VQPFIENPVDPDRMNLSWNWERGGAHDSQIVLDDWARLDEFIDRLPDPQKDPDLAALVPVAERAHAEDRYLLFSFWNLFFERPWMLRGMENTLTDFYLEEENVIRLNDAMCAQYCRYIDCAARLLEPDGFFSSDDLGHQTSPMMSPEIFHRLIYPYCVRVARSVHNHQMHFWLHICGDNTLLLPDLISAGVDMFHPVQKHTMDEAAVAREFGGRIGFLAGNGIVAGTPLENVDAFLDEAMIYGTTHRNAAARVGGGRPERVARLDGLQ